jgi:hypothetical protein
VGPVNRKEPTGFSGCPKAGPGALDGRHQCIDGIILAENHLAKLSSEIFQLGFVRCGNIHCGNAGDFGNDFFDVRRDGSFSLVDPASRMAAPASSITSIALSGRKRSFIYFADRFTGRFQCRIRVFDFVMFFVAGPQPFEDLYGLIYRRFLNIDFFKPSGQVPGPFQNDFYILRRW